jgi:alkylated DNA repair dioxygenase AlkB
VAALEVPALTESLHLDEKFVRAEERAEIVAWLAVLHPIWEQRWSARRVAAGETQRRLLRPVYWLGSWQFACLDYYRPPKHVADRCVRAEPFPPVIARWVSRIESLVRKRFRPADVPAGWKLNTCLVNFYGSRDEGDRRIDCARVGEHRDFEPGPVASVSLGERALFQFVRPGRPDEPAQVVAQHWLGDASLLVFAGDEWKQRTFHRVLRVERKRNERFPVAVDGFDTRRVNFTLRYVPEEHVTPFVELGAEARDDVRGYVAELARRSPFWWDQLRGEAAREREARSAAGELVTGDEGAGGLDPGHDPERTRVRDSRRLRPR